MDIFLLNNFINIVNCVNILLFINFFNVLMEGDDIFEIFIELF